MASGWMGSLVADRVRTTPRRLPQRQPNAVVASAEIIDLKRIDRLPAPEMWAEEAWQFYDDVGEVRFATNWLGNAMSRCRIMAARRGRGGDEPDPILVPDEEAQADDEFDPATMMPTPAEITAAETVERLAGGTSGQAQMLADFTVPLSVPGVAYLVGETLPAGPVDDENGPTLRPADLRPTTPSAAPTDPPEAWQVFSADEMGVVDVPGEGGSERRYTVRTGDGRDDVRTLSPDAIAVRVWRPHKRWHYKPDSPMRACLKALRQVDLMTQRIEADGVSRLAGAGVWFLPSEMTYVASDKNKNKTNPFMYDLLDSMIEPIRDRDKASAVVPLVVQVPGEMIPNLANSHVKFSTPFDEKVLALLESGLRRFAAGIDLPAEIVMGLADSNHWTAWQIEESALKLHVEPMLEAICAALTIGFLQPALRAAGIDDPDLIVWYDTSELTVRPDMSEPAREALDRMAISLAAYRRLSGLSEDDAPSDEELKRMILLSVIEGAPTLAPVILKALGIEVDFPTDVKPLDAPEGDGGDAPPEGEGGNEATPPTQGDPPPPPEDEAASTAALLAAADGIVVRALERAGNRLTNAARSAGVQASVNGNAAAVHVFMPEEVRMPALAEGGLLDGAWDRVPEVASRYGVEPLVLRDTLDHYTRGLIAAGFPHEWDRLREMLGA